MTRLAPFAVGLCLTVLASSPAFGAGEPAANLKPQTPKSDTQPDVLTGAIDPFAEGAERAKFLKAAGVDLELSEEELSAEQQKKGGFAREFDRWTIMERFDRDQNGTLDWIEVSNYRQSLRDHVIVRFDLNRDKKLSGPERAQAMRYLRVGDIAINDQQAGLTPAQRPIEVLVPKDGDERSKDALRRIEEKKERYAKLRESEEPARQEDVRRILREFDANANGRLDDDEYDRYWQTRIDRVRDRNHDGEVSHEENERWERSVAKSLLTRERLFDLNRDGVLDAEEYRLDTEDLSRTARVRAERRGAEIQRLVDSMDTNGDGKVDDTEREAVLNAILKE